MASFSEVYKDSGFVKSTPPFLVVPYEGIGLVYLHGLKTLDVSRELKFKRENLSVDIVKHDLYRKFMVYAENFPGRTKDEVFAETSSALTSMRSGTFILAVEGFSTGIAAQLDYEGKSGRAKLDVVTVKRRTVDVGFRFVTYQGGGTAKKPHEAEELMAVMNRLYLPGANVELRLSSSKPETINRPLGVPVTKENFINHVVPRRDSKAHVTVFFVGKWVGDHGHTLGTTFHNFASIVVTDNPHQFIAPVASQQLPRGVKLPPGISDDEINYAGQWKERPPSDRDLHIVVAHEIAHSLGAGHNDEEDNLMSMGRQDLRFNKGTVLAIGGK
jgi:hypothetical protein